MPTDKESVNEMYYDLIRKQDSYPQEEHLVTYEESELRTLEDVENDRVQELLAEDK